MSLAVSELDEKDSGELEQIMLSKLKGDPARAYSFDELADLICGQFDVEREVRWSRVVSRAQDFDFLREIYRRLSLTGACLSSLVASGKVKARSVERPPREAVQGASPEYTVYYRIAESN